MAKMLLLLQTDAPDRLQSLLEERLETAFGKTRHVTLQLMRAVADDFFYDPASLHPRPQLLVELVAAPGLPLGEFTEALIECRDGAMLASSSLALVMQEQAFIPCAPQPFYYHYLMLRRPQFSVADYMDYYRNFHSRMGFHTPAIEGYSQNYVDGPGSQAMARSLGLACREVTSISELKMVSPQQFAAHPDLAIVGEPAARDEERFVDRKNSVSFCSEVVLRIGDFDAVRAPVFEQHFPAPA